MKKALVATLLSLSFLLVSCGKDNKDREEAVIPGTNTCSEKFIAKTRETFNELRKKITSYDIDEAKKIVNDYKDKYSGIKCTFKENDITYSVDVDSVVDRTLKALELLKK